MSTQTIDVVVAGERLGVSRGTTYRLARENKLGVPVIRVGRSLKVAVQDLDRLLGKDVKAQEDISK